MDRCLSLAPGMRRYEFGKYTKCSAPWIGSFAIRSCWRARFASSYLWKNKLGRCVNQGVQHFGPLPHLSLRKRMRRENFRETRREQHHRSEGDVKIAGVIIDWVTISALTT